jgi:hypothetical protein
MSRIDRPSFLAQLAHGSGSAPLSFGLDWGSENQVLRRPAWAPA